jgi:hypothetical protein
MTRGIFLRSFASLSFCVMFAGIEPACADSSHARVVRLSVVEGDVRFTREAHGDPLADQKAVWETAQANLPIRQGYVVATDSGRAEVEFENGAMAFLSANTVLDFYDLSLNDGARTTRLVLRQGSASFYVNPAVDDYFSVTGGDFTVESSGKSSFRLNNFDDGSNVSVQTGRVSVLHKKETTALSKGQSLSMKAGEDSQLIGRLATDDDFDRWVSGRIDTVSNATNASLQYTSSPYYMAGFADLYTYGNWFSCGGYGYGWRPFGAGLSWYPFSTGQWIWDPSFGWTWASYQPWGWAPYHYGGWLFDASCGGWFYSPPVYYNVVPGTPRKRFPVPIHPPRPAYRASTAVFVRQNGKLGVVPRHPLDKEGKTPLNVNHGVFSAQGSDTRLLEPGGLANGGRKWETVKSPSGDALKSGLAVTAPPERVARTLIEGSSGSRVVSLGQNSSIVYDPHEHRFINANEVRSQGERTSGVTAEKTAPSGQRNEHIVEGNRNAPAPTVARGNTPAPPRTSAPPARSVPAPPAPRYSASSGGGSYRGGGAEYSGGSARGSSAPSGPSAGSSHASAPASSGGGGRPH